MFATHSHCARVYEMRYNVQEPHSALCAQPSIDILQQMHAHVLASVSTTAYFVGLPSVDWLGIVSSIESSSMAPTSLGWEFAPFLCAVAKCSAENWNEMMGIFRTTIAV